MRLLGGFLIGAILFFLVLPTLLVIPISLNDSSYIELPPKGLTLRWYSDFLSDPDWRAATIFSLQIALATTAASTAIGTLAAIGLVRGNLPGKTLLQALSLEPMIVPHVVFGVALYLVFSPLSLTGNFAGFLIAHTVLAVPYVIITVSAALERFDTSLELAALNCGASRRRAFCSIVLPNIAPAVAAASVFAFLASFDEATVAFFISDTGGKTISRKMFEDIDFNLTPVIAAVSTVLVAVSLLLMGTIHLLTGRGED
ncbi:ABC transporter permease [Rhizobium leguminosarum]|uniref:ABC transporter permease n=1 Tax=Rhizobium leguminosarum TaxID=384 RepID=UPI001030B7DB|nr:ABC transporter permease [Rhizobium leguminosarum]TAV40879.1 ABC transporter permease [Rhizobium leguminosarum]TAV41502.1 ABC transporter permease [Rhizobium leguminosarum]TAV61226.1 ABC transporter permease [Rhizobium leguminosarum]